MKHLCCLAGFIGLGRLLAFRRSLKCLFYPFDGSILADPLHGGDFTRHTVERSLVKLAL